MGTEVMGKVTVSAVLENQDDLVLVRKGLLAPDAVRRVEVFDALIDSSATGLLVPRSLVMALGLEPLRVRTARTANGMVTHQVYHQVQLTVQGRDCRMDVGEVSDDLPVIICQLPLEAMDWVIDMRDHKLIGNPDHGGVQMMDII